LPVSGDYTFYFDPPMACDRWESSKVSPAPLRVESKADLLTIELWPFGPNPHDFRGTLYDNGAVNTREITSPDLIGIPIADITGVFTSSESAVPFTFRGSLTLTGATQDPDASNGALLPACSSSYSLVAFQRSAPPIDAGSSGVDR
jgi:hypothetical protein